jgi:tetratricopeptide (TPR) repeat protein
MSSHKEKSKQIQILIAMASCALTTQAAAQGAPLEPAAPGVAQEQLRRSAQDAWSAGERAEHRDLLMGYLQLGALRDGWLLEARLNLAEGRCEDAQQSLARADATPRYNQNITREALEALERELRATFVVACDQPMEAAELYQLGQGFFQARQWAYAARAFERAFAADPDPALAYNAGRSYEYAGQLPQALSLYEAALSQGPEGELGDKIRDNLERLRNISAHLNAGGDGAETGLLDLSTTPAGALVLVDGRVIGQTPLQTAWPAGRFSLALQLEGHQTQQREVELEAGRELVWQAQLPEDGRLWTWVSLGGGAASLGAGVIFGLLAQDRLDEANGLEAARDAALLDRLKEEGRTWSLLSLGFYVLGGVLVGGSAALYVLEGPEAQPAPAPGEAALWWEPTRGLWGVQGRW